MRQYPRIVMDRKEATARSWSSTAAATASRTRTCSRSAGHRRLESRRQRGTAVADGGNSARGKTPTRCRLFYPGRDAKEGPIPSIRLKAYRRGQQDVEYLTLLSQVKGAPRGVVGDRVRAALHLAAARKINGGGDPGLLTFAL